MRLPRSRRLRAFTLLEIMVALGLLSFIVVAIYSSWNAILKGSKLAQGVAANSQRARIAMSTLQDSLLSTCMFSENSKYYGFVSESDGDYCSLSFVARLPKSFPRSGEFGDQDLRRLSFTVEDGPDSQKQLVLRQNPILMDLNQNEQETPLVLARDLKRFALDFWDISRKDWVQDWTTTNQMPMMVKISIEVGRTGRNSEAPQEAMFCTVVMPAQAVRREWQVPQTGPVPGLPGQPIPGQPVPGAQPGTGVLAPPVNPGLPGVPGGAP